MDYAALTGVVVNGSVIFICDFLTRPICGGGNSRPPLTPADDFNTAMVNSDRVRPLSFFVEYVTVKCYNLFIRSGKVGERGMDVINSFEAVCRYWEQRMKEFVNLLSDGCIPTLKNAQWIYEKKYTNVYPADETGRKPRGARGPTYCSGTPLNRTAANAVWKIFKQLARAHGLPEIERLRNNEKELGRYDFRATNNDTGDTFSCDIELSGEWNRPGIYLHMFIGPRYRNVDLQGSCDEQQSNH